MKLSSLKARLVTGATVVAEVDDSGNARYVIEGEVEPNGAFFILLSDLIDQFVNEDTVEGDPWGN